jgi:oligopeptide/dipeptide ABC transporter ATP-binding protein
MSEPLLIAEDLTRSYAAGRGGWFRKPPRFNAVDGVSLEVHRHETLGIVGESGCGKSTLARLLLGLSLPDTGRVLFDGQDIATLDTQAWRALRQRMQLVFQDTGGALDPRLPIRLQVREALEIHTLPDADARTEAMLAQVRLGEHLWDRYPHELSGGQLQRVIIARALVLEPDLLVLDEPVSALDVSIQAQIVNLLVELQRRMALAYVFVSHDLGVVRHVADRVAVMYLGRVVETAPKAALFARPRHPYTAALLAAIPTPDPARRRRGGGLTGDPPSPQNPPSGCRFHPRCPFAVARCAQEAPALRPLGAHQIACHRAEEIEMEPPQREVA